MRSKLFIFLLLMFFGFLKIDTALAQSFGSVQTENNNISNESTQSEDATYSGKKKNKNKNKEYEKEQIEFNEFFFYNLAINLASVLIIILCIYYPNYKNREIIFTFFLFNIAIFLLTFLLNKIKISMGAAFGLFAVFSMLRYRTEGISMKDMTYLFIVIAIGLLSAIPLDFYEIAVINGIIILSTWLLDGNIILKREYSKVVQYENIELIKPDQHLPLIEDLKSRTGINIHRISINKIDFLKDVATLTIYYYADTKNNHK